MTTNRIRVLTECVPDLLRLEAIWMGTLSKAEQIENAGIRLVEFTADPQKGSRNFQVDARFARFLRSKFFPFESGRILATLANGSTVETGQGIDVLGLHEQLVAEGRSGMELIDALLPETLGAAPLIVMIYDGERLVATIPYA